MTTPNVSLARSLACTEEGQEGEATSAAACFPSSQFLGSRLVFLGGGEEDSLPRARGFVLAFVRLTSTPLSIGAARFSRRRSCSLCYVTSSAYVLPLSSRWPFQIAYACWSPTRTGSRNPRYRSKKKRRMRKAKSSSPPPPLY